MVISGSHMSFPPVNGKEVVVEFDGGCVSSDAGILLLKEIDARLGLTNGLSACIQDKRQQSKVQQSVWDMLRQRIFGIAQGYEDCNDFDTLCSDPAFKVAADRAPLTSSDLASQPTLSRLENSISTRDLLAMADFLVQIFIKKHQGSAPTQIILDIDATDDPAHGQQEFEFYHGYYQCHCFLPLLVYATADTGEQELLAAVLRPGNKHAGHGSVSVLRRIVQKLKQAFPTCRFIVRGDAGFALPALYNWCEESSVDYVLSLAKNSRLLHLSEEFEKEARELYDQAVGLAPPVATAQALAKGGANPTAQAKEKVRHFGEITYAAQTWPKARRVVVKAEMMAKGYNPRFVVTNLPGDDPVLDTPSTIYNFYTDRGDVENRIKELKNGLLSGRTSCHRFRANQFRLLLHAVAFVLLQALRQVLKGTEGAQWQAGTIRTKILKVGALITETVRRIVFKLPSSHPRQHLWKHLAVEIG